MLPVGLRQEVSSVIQRRRAEGAGQRIGQRGFDALGGLYGQSLELPIMGNQDAVLVQPPLQFMQQLAALGPDRRSLSQRTT